MTLGGFIIWILLGLIRQAYLILHGATLMIPFFNVFFASRSRHTELHNICNDNLWDEVKTEYEVVYEEKVVKRTLKKVR